MVLHSAQNVRLTDGTGLILFSFTPSDQLGISIHPDQLSPPGLHQSGPSTYASTSGFFRTSPASIVSIHPVHYISPVSLWVDGGTTSSDGLAHKGEVLGPTTSFHP